VATIVRKYYTPSGIVERVSEIQYACTSHHSMVVKLRQIYPGPAEAEMYTHVTDFDKGEQIYLDPVTKSVTTMSYSQQEQASFLRGSWDETCPKPSDGETVIKDEGAVMFGYRVLRLTTRFTPDWTAERWMAPDLECFALKEIHTSKGTHNDSLVTAITEGEPAIELFQTPQDYVERSPLEVESRHKDATGNALWGPALAKRRDARYQTRKVQ
jgi:hypothetical protein